MLVFRENLTHVLNRKILSRYVLIPNIYNITYFARLLVAKQHKQQFLLYFFATDSDVNEKFENKIPDERLLS